MQCRIADLRCKEVINICNGFRLGFVCDVLLDTLTGNILALVVPGPCRFFGLFWHEDDFVIPWECIRRIGDDIILIEVDGTFRREKRRKGAWV
ncbi:sporulation protein, YlmC/YmxH family [Sporobacter termitidis DSM 10068]|uniref:Sporulation protein, YlmC/YmxH family n=1 Tax=Sporobacter termitidis DSM 10068 TaxID=1123282 RepID=A0A1M5TQZ5_9FIRM|nr:YlmC/YmxH family sporulation protein [Sporobacter termitidis]SHH53080.1 sporulation protein, YlmC/YmxH family [Sporobacter termitidis DSM 10068]